MNFATVENWPWDSASQHSTHCRTFMLCHPERALCAKDLCSWAVPLRWTKGMAVLLKASRSQVDRILDPNRDITLSSLQRERLWWDGGRRLTWFDDTSRLLTPPASFRKLRCEAASAVHALRQAVGKQNYALAHRANSLWMASRRPETSEEEMGA